jgi:hypothetical protein
MSKEENGGPAFSYGSDEHGGDEGMTLRDYFAGQALAGYFANPHTPHQDAAGCGGYMYEAADAMLEARKVPTGETT